MSIQETNEISEDIIRYLDWTLETGLWDGHSISWLEGSEFLEEVHSRILQFLFTFPDSPFSHRFEAQLAWIGASPEERSLLDREIAALDFSKGDVFLPVGQKSFKHFWKKHKKEVLIGLAVVAAITVVTIIAVSAAGIGTGAAAGIALRESEEKKKKATPNSSPKRIEPVPSDPPLPKSALVFEETGMTLGGQFTSYQDILLNRNEFILPLEASFPVSLDTALAPNRLSRCFEIEEKSITGAGSFDSNQSAVPVDSLPLQETLPPRLSTFPPSDSSSLSSFFTKFFDTVGRSMIEPELFDPNAAISIPERSSSFSTQGEREPWLYIGGINGMNTTEEKAMSHAAHLAQFTQGHPVDWVYNRSHGPVVDILEIITLNLPGFSPDTTDLLLESWKAFCERNVDPDIKLVQFCHSQSTIHVRNGLEKAPQEIRDRVIVHAFGPAVIIEDDLCYQAWHYACEGDIVPYGELAYSQLAGGMLKANKVAKKYEKIIWIKRHPDTKSPHDFQNPAFDQTKKNILEKHQEKKGRYKRENR